MNYWRMSVARADTVELRKMKKSERMAILGITPLVRHREHASFVRNTTVRMVVVPKKDLLATLDALIEETPDALRRAEKLREALLDGSYDETRPSDSGTGNAPAKVPGVNGSTARAGVGNTSL